MLTTPPVTFSMVTDAFGRTARIDIRNLPHLPRHTKLWIERVGEDGYRYAYAGCLGQDYWNIHDVAAEFAESTGVYLAHEPSRNRGFGLILLGLMRELSKTGFETYCLRVDLADTAVWRALRAPVDIDLERLHDVIQALMGWSASEPYVFESSGYRFGCHSQEPAVLPARDVRLSQLFDPDGVLTYRYGHDGRWPITVHLPEAPFVRRSPDWSFPTCLGGLSEAPPEELHGPDEYKVLRGALLRTARNQPRLNPDAFDVRGANRRIQTSMGPLLRHVA